MKAAVGVLLGLALSWPASAAAAPDCEAQVQFISHELAHNARLANRWNQGWTAGLALATAGQAAVIPLVSTDDRVDYYVGAASSLAGIVSLAVMPPTAIEDAVQFENHKDNTDRCALAHEGEKMLERGAKYEESTTGVLAHIGNIAFNLGLGAILGFGFHHWESALINVVAGTAVGEALVLSYPATLRPALEHYRAGDFTLAPTTRRAGVSPGAGLTFTF